MNLLISLSFTKLSCYLTLFSIQVSIQFNIISLCRTLIFVHICSVLVFIALINNAFCSDCSCIHLTEYQCCCEKQSVYQLGKWHLRLCKRNEGRLVYELTKQLLLAFVS